MKRVVVVGAGRWGRNLVDAFAGLGALAGVAEADPALRDALAARYPQLNVLPDFRAALHGDADALVFATPAPTHYAFAKAALEAGMHVFVEKPMTLSSKEAISLATYADQHDLTLMVGHLLLYQPAIAWMRDYLATGEAGAVRHVHTRRAKLGTVRRDENVWWSFAPHDISVVVELLGHPKLEEVRAQGQAVLQREVEDSVHVDLGFAGGKSAHIHVSWWWPLNERRTTVMAEKKMLVYDEVAQTVTVYDKGVDSRLCNRDQGSFVADIADAKPLELECCHFLECLETGARPRSDGWNGVAVVEILERGQEALRGKLLRT